MTSKPIDKSAAQLAFVRNEIFSREPSEKDLHKVGRSNSNENLSLRPKIMDKGTRTANSSFVDLSSMASGLGDMNRYEMRIIKDSSHSITSRNGSRLSLAASKVSLIDSRRGSGAKTPSPKGSAIALNSLNFSLTAKNFSLAVAAARGELPTVTSKSNQNLDKSLGASLFQQSLGKPASNGVSPVPGGRRETVTNPYDDGHFNALRKVYKLAIHDFRILKIKMKPNQQDFNAVLKDDKCRDIADAVKIFSVKKLDKSDIETQKAIDKLIELKLDASRIRHVFCTSLVSILQDASSIYCVFDSNNYTLEDVLMTQNRKLPEGVARFYMAEILLGLDYLHSLNIIHADLNPENIIISAHGHVKLINPVFLRGLEQVTSLSAARRPSLGGSPGYISPEAIHLKVFDKLLDYWALGCILHELLLGQTPFPRDIRNPIYEEMISMTMKSDPELPTLLHFAEKSRKLSPHVKDLMIRLLSPRPKDRLGAWHGSEDIKCHSWFKDVPRWKAIEDCQVAAPYLPDAISEGPVDRSRYGLASDDFADEARGPQAEEYRDRLCFVG